MFSDEALQYKTLIFFIARSTDEIREPLNHRTVWIGRDLEKII